MPYIKARPYSPIPPASFGRRVSPWRSWRLWAVVALILVAPPIVALAWKAVG